MDPYDDYDPEQYDYGDSDDDGGNIVYLEGPTDEALHPFLPHPVDNLLPPSQLSQSSAPDIEAEAEPLKLLPRWERKRRRRLEAVARVAKGDDDVSDASSEHEAKDTAGDEQGAFASLQQLLLSTNGEIVVGMEEANQQQSVSVEQEDSQKEVDYLEPVRPFTPHTQDGALKLTNDSQPGFSHRGGDVSQQQSQKDAWEAAGCVSNENDNNTLPMRTIRLTPWLNAADAAPNQTLERALRRQRSQRQAGTAAHSSLTLSAGATAPQSTSLLSELEKSRKLATKRGNTRTGHRGPAQKSQPKRAQSFSQSQSIRSASSAISIVGSRPQHWGARRDGLLAEPFNKSRTSGKLQHAINTRDPFQSRKGRRPLLSVLDSRTPSSALRGARQQQAAPQAEAASEQQVRTTTSFAPSFWTAKPRQTDEVQDSASQLQTTADLLSQQTPRPRGVLSPSAAASSNGSAPHSNPRRHQKFKAGPLMKRLRAIRGSLRDDKVRFQSGLYPFPKRGISVDRSDPRRRASHYIDVTLVAAPVPWEEEQAHVTVLGYVHAVVPISSRGAQQSEKARDGFSAWISFSLDTAREQKLQSGTQLRIYNSVQMSLPEAGGPRDELIVLCTQLCEPYPSVLPPLASPPWLLSQSRPHDDHVSY